MVVDYDEVITNQPVVIDNGSGTIKAGFAGEEKARVVFPTFVGRPKYTRVLTTVQESDVFLGARAEANRGLLKLDRPMKRGIVENWNDMELLWSLVYSELKINQEDHPVLMTEMPLNPRRNREKLAEVFFETFGVPAFFVALQAMLSLYASGRTTGVVLDSGDGVSHAVPIYEGFAIPHAMCRSDVGGRDVTENLALQLRRAGHVFHTTAEMDIVKSMKEKACFVAFKPQKLEDSYDVATKMGSGGTAFPYQLPDGAYVVLSNERQRAPEVLFHPMYVGCEYPGLHELLATSIVRADLDLRKTLFKHIVLSGGSTLFAGLGDRLLNELRKLAPKETRIRITAPPERLFSTYLGGSILSSLASFKKLWISKLEYEEEGLPVIHRRTF
ncbi:MAG: hypothetical protein KVP17_005019 [Porospora cf. gigantea B]|uniref:uncharacterized protein n=2 Tax=Porospora cf. gigantea B TaxID=2853592 RepID=UPI0035719BDA|nr:MAG: hypothetical protein KVP17_005019 [Porospora cf. gigantea B]